jgi:cation transport protein ChaC
MITITYFGYGSLVNAATVPDGAEIVPGRLKGWVREWRVCGVWENGQGRCALSVRQEPGSEIRGVMTREQQSRLHALEQRESRYAKIGQIGTSFRCEAESNPGPEELFLFKATPENERWGCDRHPILQSYLDCVLAGFHQIWGEEGVSHFFDTTDGWHVPVLKDRAAPLYPRAVEIDTKLLQLFDDHVERQNLTLISA